MAKKSKVIKTPPDINEMERTKIKFEITTKEFIKKQLISQKQNTDLMKAKESKHTGIKSSELRIGNYGLKDSKTYRFKTGKDIDQSNKIEPITINQNELSKLGFKRKVTSNVYWKDTYGVDLGFKTYFIQRSNTNKRTFWIRTELEYVHTLQNIFYAVTNKELNNESK